MMLQLLTFLLVGLFLVGSFTIIYIQVTVARDTYRDKKQQRALRNSSRPIRFKVTKREDMSPRHFSVCLTPLTAKKLPRFMPGQYLTLMPAIGHDSKITLKRCYSLAAWHKKPQHYELGIAKEPDGVVSTWLHQNLTVGSIIDALPPKGTFVYRPQLRKRGNEHTVLIAGGIGITPLRAMIDMFINSIGQGQSLVLFYSAKTHDQMCYLSELNNLAYKHPSFNFYPIISRPTSEWQGLTGRIDTALIASKLAHELGNNSANYYMCGPQTMMAELKQGLLNAGTPMDNIHYEHFGVNANIDTDNVYPVKLNNHQFEFSTQRTLLDAMEQNEIAIESECRSGSCGHCKVTLTSGRVKELIKSDIRLNTNEILPCCCIPSSAVTLEMPI
ncbi:MAG: 2Fe-2S iron-sulfur cluster binding domain-containing protein [Gammaproteobacteria bacterium]|nr:2Fe-2S iron-sulfur cluster binding domain-containing protein [Gammaproteobacteria bacterium]